jgi:K+-transporting ATPase ATPase B chain
MTSPIPPDTPQRDERTGVPPAPAVTHGQPKGGAAGALMPAAAGRRAERAGLQVQQRSFLDPQIVRAAIGQSFVKLNPATLWKNPVMLVVEIGSVLATSYFLGDFFRDGGDPKFSGMIAVWLWFTVLFANFAEALAEGRGKAQADTLRRTRTETMAKRERPGGGYDAIASTDLRRGDIVRVDSGDLVPSDGDVIEGIAYVNEAAITGESAPVLKEPGTDIRSTVTGGTTVVSDWLRVQITANPGETFLDKMIGLVEGAQRQKTPNEIALNILIAGLTLIFLLAVVTLQPFAIYSNSRQDMVVLIALLVALIPTTIGALLSAIGIAGMNRLVSHNVLALSGRAVEAAGDADTLLLDKTGTITFGNRLASEFIPANGVGGRELAAAALRSSIADETPEGKSIVELAQGMGLSVDGSAAAGMELIPFTAETRMSGVKQNGHQTMKGALDAIERIAPVPQDLKDAAQRVAMAGGTPLVVVEDGRALGVIYLKDTVKPGMRERFDMLRRMGIRTIMVTGDNRLTAATIAAEAGVDDYVAESKPEDKIRLIREEQAKGRLVAMTGDGTNDAPALAQADVGVAMNTGTMAAKEAGNMVDLDSDPTKLIEIVAIGKQLLMTRGALTTFSIANDVAKYFAIIPAMFVVTFPVLNDLNIMRLHSPQSAIVSAIIFNALIIVALIPLALRGVAYKAMPAAALLRRNLLIYGAGGIIAPFIGIKAIDLIVGLVY